MPLILPAKPAPREISWEKISAANVLSPAFGGAEQELNRKGTRWALTFSMRPMTYVQSMDWDDLESEGQTVVMRVHQPGLDIGTPGQPRVATSGQLGSTVLLDGLTPTIPSARDNGCRSSPGVRGSFIELRLWSSRLRTARHLFRFAIPFANPPWPMTSWRLQNPRSRASPVTSRG